jgi:phenylacetic acid degradation operon negative regulatory protein
LKSRHLSQWISKFLDQHPTRANSLIITIYGDFIAPHGGTVWLGSFIRLVEPLGLNERMVRTSVYRLSQEKWLVSEQIGRRSYYSLTTSGPAPLRARLPAHLFRAAGHLGRRMATGADSRFAGRCARDQLRKELTWAGYGALASGILAHPSADTEALLDILQETGAHDKVVAMRAATSAP